MYNKDDFKLKLMAMVAGQIEAKGWKQMAAGVELGCSQHTISCIKSGRLGRCSTTKLVEMLNTMGYQVDMLLTKI